MDAEEIAASNRELIRLRESPVGDKPDPAVETLMQTLPFHELEWPDFEKLVERLVELEGDAQYVARYGGPGDAQEGIDILAAWPLGGGYAVYQCRRLQDVFPSDIRGAVDDFLAGVWASEGASAAQTFVFCTSFSLVRKSLADEIEAQSRRLAGRSPPVVFDAWGEEALSKKLKAHPELVEDFFGVSFAERFSPGGKGQPVAQLAGLLERFNDVAETLELHTERERVVVTTLSWAPELLKQRLERLARDDETAFVALTKLVGEPPDIDVVLANIETPAAWLTDASSDVWDVIALMAEERGEWPSASHAWYEAATRTSDDYAAAGRLVSAAAAGHIGGDDTRRDELLAQARERFRDHPRVLIEDARGRPPQEQLDLLLHAKTRDPLDVALVSSQRALSCLLLPDLEAAEAHLAEAKNALPHSLTTDSVEVNLVVQRGRLNQYKGGSQRVDALRGASRRALAIRDALLRQHRWEESGRLLMLAADALGLQGELAGARDILVQALPAELAAPDVAEVLGLAAIRTFAPREALELTKDAEQTSAVRCIRATATLQVVGASTTQRRQAVDELDVLVAEGGLNGLDAAFSRLMEAMAHGDWSDAAERLLTETGHERPATVLKALYLGARKADWEGAYALVDQMSDEAWAPPARLRLACRWGKHSVIREAADALMATAPGQGLRLECGQAYGKIREYARAREVLMSVANDDTAPSALRAHAYALLVLTVGRHLQDWAEADRLHQAWIDLRPGDARASAFAPEIANRLARERGAR